MLTDFNIFLQKKIINLILQEPDNFCALRTNNQGETMRKLALNKMKAKRKEKEKEKKSETN